MYEPVKKGIVISASNALLILGLVVFGIVPQLAQLATNRSLIKERKAVVTQTQERLKEINEIKPIIEASTSTFTKLQNLIPKKMDLSALVELLSVKTSQHLFQLVYLSPASTNPTSYTGFKEMLIRIDARGSQQNILSLIEDLESGDRFVGVKSVQIENFPKEGVGSARLNLAVYSHD